MKKNYSLPVQCTWLKTILGTLFLMTFLDNSAVFGQTATYTQEVFNASIPANTVGVNFRSPIADWTQARLSGLGAAPNNFQWLSAGANYPVAANQNITGFPTGAGFVRYLNRTVAHPAASGAVNGDAAFLVTRSLDFSGHTAYSATADTIGISIYRDATAGAVASVLDSVVIYINTSPTPIGATRLNELTTGSGVIHRSATQTPVVGAAGWYRYRYVVPNESRFVSGTGGTSSAYIIIACYSLGGNNIYLDNFNMPQWPTNMQVTGVSVIAPLNADVGKGTLDNLMLQVQVTTKGSLNPRRIDGIAFSTNGSTAFTTDIVQPNGPKCWYTGGLLNFATTGGAVSIPKVNPTTPSYSNATLYFGNMSATTGCPLGGASTTVNFYPGNENFVWLAYDITANAITGQNVAAAFEHLFTGWSSPNSTGCTGDTIVTASNIQVPLSVAAFTPAPGISAVRQIDQAYTIPTYYSGTSGWSLNYNTNDFVSGVNFPGDNGTAIDNYIHDVACAYCVATAGQNCDRFSCHPPDYTYFPPVNLGIYQNRFVQVTHGHGLRSGGAPYLVKAQCGTWFTANAIGVFIDWNKDGDFDDRYGTGVGADGYIYENYGSKQQAQANMALPAVWGANTSWFIDVPLPTDVVVDQNNALQPPNNSIGPIVVGNVRMRVREVYAAPASAPGVIGVHPTQSGYQFGEVEDYTLQVLDACPSSVMNVCKWAGASTDWKDPNNWCPAVPTKDDIAYINTGPQNMPVILDNTTAVCRTLKIMPGANLRINARNGSSLKVYDDVEIGSGATVGTGSCIAVTSDFSNTLTIPGKSSIPPAGLALVPQTPFRTNAQAKTQIAYTAAELTNTYGWRAGDIIDQLSIEVSNISGGAGPSTYQNFRIQAFLTSAPVTFPFPAPANTKIAVAAGDPIVVAGWPRIIYGPGLLALNMPMGTLGTQAGGNYYTFNLIPNTLIWDGVSNLVLSFENHTASGLTPAKSYVLYDEPNSVFSVLSVNYPTTTVGPITGYSIDGAGHFSGGINAGITASTSHLRPRLDFKWHRPYNQFPITVGGDWINNNKLIRTTAYSTTPVYGIAGDSGFIASNSKVIFDPTNRNTVISPGLASANLNYYTGIPGPTLSADDNQDITSEISTAGNSTVFNILEINKASAGGKAVQQNSAFTPLYTGHYADTLKLTNGELNLNRKEFTLQKSSANSLTRTSGWLRSEDNSGGPLAGNIQSKFTWKIGTGTTGNYNIPFKGAPASVFNFSYNKTVAADSVGDLSVATYGTPAQDNTPYPVAPQTVYSMTTDPPPALDATPWTVDRFWFVDRNTTSALTGTITFEYHILEGTALANYVAGEMRAQRYEIISGNPAWHAPYPGQADGVNGANRFVNHSASYIDNTYNIWAVVHITTGQEPLGGGGCIAATPAITPNGAVSCVDSVQLSSTAATSYLWSNGSTLQNITAATTGTYIVTVTDGGGCTASSTAVNVTIKPIAIATAGGPTIICSGESVTLSANSNSNYLWSNGETTQNIIVTTPGNYIVTVTNASGCTASSSPTTVTVNPNPTASFISTGPTTYCENSNSLLLDAGTDTTLNYQWLRNGNQVASIDGGNNPQFYPNISGSYEIVFVNQNGCADTSASIAVNVLPLPAAVATPLGPTTFCSGGSVILSANADSTVTYQWKKGGATIAGATASNYTATLTDSYKVVITGANGCSKESNMIAVTVNPLPTASITSGSPTIFCSGDSVILTANAGSGFTYQWKKGTANIAGATSQQYTAKTSGTYKVIVTNSNGCSKTSAGMIVTVNALPTATITPQGPTTFCNGDSVILQANGGAGFSWVWKKGTTVVSTLQNYTAKTGGTYKVTVTNSNGCSKTSTGTVITVNALPTATITALGPITFCNGDSVVLQANGGTGLSYVWRKGTSPTVLSTLQNYTAKIAGTYKVTVTDINNCTKTSAGKTITINCKLDAETINDFRFELYPNPTTGITKLVFNLDKEQTVEINLLNILGEKVMMLSSGVHPAGEKELEFDVTQISEGIYFVELITTENQLRKKLIVIK